MMQVGTFSEYVVASERSIVKIDESIPFHAGALVSCGATTGWGSATVSAGTESGDTVVVIGVGGVGMSAVQGARAAGARQVIAVDPVESKRAGRSVVRGDAHQPVCGRGDRTGPRTHPRS